MKRRKFFEILGIGTASVVFAHKAIAEIIEKPNGLPGVVEQLHQSKMYIDVEDDNLSTTHSWYKGKVTDYGEIYALDSEINTGLKNGDNIFVMTNGDTSCNFRAIITHVEQLPYLNLKYRQRHYNPEQLTTRLTISPYKKEQPFRGAVDILVISRKFKSDQI